MISTSDKYVCMWLVNEKFKKNFEFVSKLGKSPIQIQSNFGNHRYHSKLNFSPHIIANIVVKSIRDYVEFYLH